MSISKIMVALLVSVVAMTAMTGVAVAYPANVNIVANPIINPLDGSTVTSTDAVTYNIDYVAMGSSHGRHICVMTSNANLYARITGNGVNTSWTNNALVGGNYTATSPSNYTFTLEVKGTEEGQVTVYDNAGNQFNASAGYDFASCTRSINVPEFTTIALPALSILGLFLYFRYKRKNE
ncbi:MAG: hypothetical protein WAV32_04445 [Halobacteriota archaeon]